MVQDVVRQGISPATGSEVGSQSVVDFNLKVDGVMYVPVSENNTLNGGKDQDGAIKLSLNAEGDLILNSYADGKWTEYVTVLDGLKSIGGINLSGNQVTVVAPVKWRINSVNYQKDTNTILTISSATDGFKRIDYIYADANNNILLIEGTEVADGNPYIPPTLPVNTVMVAPVYISGDTVTQPIPDLSQYLTKGEAEQLYSVISPSGAYIQATPASPQVADIRTAGLIDVFNSLKGRLIVGEEIATIRFGEYPNSSSGQYQISQETTGEKVISFFTATSGDSPVGDGKQRGIFWHSDDNGGIIINDVVSHRGLTGAELFTVTDPKDYTQAGYVDEENRKSILQNIKSYSILGGLDANKRNYGFVLIADSNGEGYVSTGVGENNWFTILTRNIQSIQGGKSGIGFSDFNDPSRYDITISSGVSILPYGPVKQGLFMNAGSSITFSAASDFVEVWYWNDAVAGSLEFRRNGVLYRTISAAATHNEVVSSFDETPTPDGSMATYEIKAVDSSVFVTTLFKDIKYAEGNDTYYFLRHAVAGKSFDDFDLPQLLAVNSLSTEVPRAIYLCALGTNSIYSPDKAQTSTNYAVSLRSYIQTLKVNDNKFVYIMPPKGLETTYPPILEPYLNYYNIAKQVCLEERVMFIDANELDFNTHPEYYGSDGLHYSDAGNIALGNFVTNQLAKADLRSFDYISYPSILPAKIGAWSIADEFARFGHNNFDISTSYGFLQADDGKTYVSGVEVILGGSGEEVKALTAPISSTGLLRLGDVLTGKTTGANNTLAGTGTRPVAAAADGTLTIDTGGARLAGGNVFTGGHQDVRNDGDFRVFNTASGASNYNSVLNSGGVVLTSTDQGTVTTYGQNFLQRLHSSGFYSRLTFATPASANREYTLPDASGTIALTSDLVGTTVNSPSTALALTDRGYYNYTGVGNATWTLPSVAANTGKFYRIYNKTGGNGGDNTGTLTIDASGSEEIFRSGAWSLTLPLAFGESITLVSDGIEWNAYG